MAVATESDTPQSLLFKQAVNYYQTMIALGFVNLVAPVVDDEEHVLLKKIAQYTAVFSAFE